MHNYFTLIFIFLGFANFSFCQEGTIKLKNGSFEGPPHSGNTSNLIIDWYDCGPTYFPGQSPPDLHLDQSYHTNEQDVYFNVKRQASDGKTFLGLVGRADETYEAITQRLETIIKAGKCYNFSIDLARSLNYVNQMISSTDPNYDPEVEVIKITRPLVLRIYGGTTPCGMRQLLAESEPVKNTDWETYDFTFEAKQTYRYITISVFYTVPVMLPYNGNLLLDNATDITLTPCPDEEIIAEQVEEPKEPIKKDPVKVVQPDPIVAQNPVFTKPKEQIVTSPPPKIRINRDLNRKTLREGQTMNIKTLSFDANSSEIKENSFPALDELVDFLKYYEEIKIEIGGHTNMRPKDAFCDSLSDLRAKAVAQYIYNKSIPRERVSYKGYGKRKPIIPNKTPAANTRNQRVEIKVLSLKK